MVGIQKARVYKITSSGILANRIQKAIARPLRLMKQAEKFGRPVVTFINTAGAYPGVGAEERGQGEAMLAISWK